MNIAELISTQAQLHPHKRAVVMSRRRRDKGYNYPCYSFEEFESRSNQIVTRLRAQGFSAGERVLLFVRPSLDFSVITFALFKAGLVPVFIDPGMGRKNLLKAVAEVSPQGMVAEREVFLGKWLFPTAFRSVKRALSVPGLLKGIEKLAPDIRMHMPAVNETAAILFTSGGTGSPKGVITTHEILRAQTHMLQEMFALNSGDTDLPGFPLFALFTLAMGMTSVIPDMDPTHPADSDPKRLVQALVDQRITFAAGSPAIWEKVGRYCQEQKITLPFLKRVVMFGAPVRGEVHELWKPILPHGTTYAPYGATECLPIAFERGDLLLSEWPANQRGAGTCLGTPVNGMKISIDKAADIPNGFPLEVGEILVQGPTVTPGYFAREDATAAAKIPHADGLIHRMGDVGYMKDGKLWFCGRKAHVVVTANETFYPIPVEGIFNTHPQVKRSALVAIKHGAGLVVEPNGDVDWKQLVNELQSLAFKYSHTKNITKFFLHKNFPVDVRHNIKIDRKALSLWAQEQA